MPEPPADPNQPEQSSPAAPRRVIADWEHRTAYIQTFQVRITALDTGIRPESNTCSGGPGGVRNGTVSAHLGNPGQQLSGSIFRQMGRGGVIRG